MKKVCWIIIGLLLVCFAATESSFAISKKNISKPKANVVKKFDLEEEFYKKAEIELDRQLYREYRVTERIIRANKLDDYPWVIVIPNSKDYIVNASTEQGNLITIESGIMNTFYDDVSALAFITAHEMAHEILMHLYRQKQYEQVLDKNYQDNINSSVDNLSDLIGKYIILTPIVGSYGASTIAKTKLDEEQQNLDKKKAENDYDKQAFSRKCEYEADKLALIMMIKAGFSPASSIKSFEFFKRLPEPLEEDSSHPAIQNRIWQIKTTLKNLNIVQLKKDGLYNIKKSKPLTYEKSYYKEKDEVRKKSIVINSKFATENPNDPFKKMFGK